MSCSVKLLHSYHPCPHSRPKTDQASAELAWRYAVFEIGHRTTDSITIATDTTQALPTKMCTKRRGKRGMRLTQVGTIFPLLTRSRRKPREGYLCPRGQKSTCCALFRIGAHCCAEMLRSRWGLFSACWNMYRERSGREALLLAYFSCRRNIPASECT